MKRKSAILSAAIIAALSLFALVACEEPAVDVTPPVLYASSYSDAFVGNEVTVKECKAVDDVDGQVAVFYEVYSPDGAKVAVTDGKFTLNAAGEWRVRYYATDGAGNSAEKTFSFNVTVSQSARSHPVILIGDYSKTVSVGSVYSLPEITATDAVDGAISYSLAVIDPYGKNVYPTGGEFFVEYAGTYYINIGAVNTANKTTTENVSFTATETEKSIAAMSSRPTASEYENSTLKGRFGGMRDLEYVDFSCVRKADGVYFYFDASGDEHVSSRESIEIYFDSKGKAEAPSPTTRRTSFYLNGVTVVNKGTSIGSWTIVSDLKYSERTAALLTLCEGSTLTSGDEDNGYFMEVFVPYALIGINAGESFYTSFGVVREKDQSGWDGWNFLGIYPDVNVPAKYAEFTVGGVIRNTNRLYSAGDKADGNVNDEVYSSVTAAKTTVGGLRGLEKASVTLARSSQGLHFAFDVADDRHVNNGDRIELCVHVGETAHTLYPDKDFHFWIQASGFLSVMRGNGRSYDEFLPSKEYRPQVYVGLHDNTTININTDEDNGYYGELFIPWSYFNAYSSEIVSQRTRLFVTFGLWRVSSEVSETTDWGLDPNKDWDGWNAVSFPRGFCDPLYPDTYAAFLANGNLVSQDDVIDVLHDPVDSSVDGILDEEYWYLDQTAVLSLDEYPDRDRADALIFRDQTGLRLAVKAYAKNVTKKDVVMLYINTKDTSYVIGSEYLDDKYEVRGQYANEGDFMFRLELDRSVQVFEGLYKDWAKEITDLSSLSVEINTAAVGCSYVIEAFIPYTFLSTGGHNVTRNDILGFSFRLAGENERGSVVWNNYHFGGVYCDSESPASYARVDGLGNVFAALDNSGDYRVDGKFDEAVYSSPCAEIACGDGTANIFRSDKGLHVKYVFGSADEMALTLSTVDHGLDAPYVYDYRITLKRDGTLGFSYGNTHGYYEQDIYIPYSSPRAVMTKENGKVVAELFVSYDYLSRYNTTGRYTEKGYMQITSQSALRFAFDATFGEEIQKTFTYNGEVITADSYAPDTYATLTAKEN
ncbi:MAG: hypothetical protein J5762_05345 [Clostridia bacterium]|nr:hypothetical protein [Clostridia bacterium]